MRRAAALTRAKNQRQVTVLAANAVWSAPPCQVQVERRLRNTGRPSLDAAWTWNTRFAKSIPMIVAFSMDAFSSRAGHATAPARHTSMPSGGGIHPIKPNQLGRFDGLFFLTCQGRKPLPGSRADQSDVVMACAVAATTARSQTQFGLRWRRLRSNAWLPGAVANFAFVWTMEIERRRRSEYRGGPLDQS